MAHYIKNNEVIELIAKGERSDIFKAVDEKKKFIAVKVFEEDVSNRIISKISSKEEMQKIIKLEHSNVIKVNDYCEYRGRVCCLMELIDGIELSKAIIIKGHYDEKDSLVCILQLIGALKCIHASGIEYNIYPKNIFLTSANQIKLLNVGFEQEKKPPHSIVHNYSILPNPSYFSPEILEDDEKSNDEKSYIFSAGSVLFHILTGVYPFGNYNKSDPVSTMMRTIEDEVDVQEINPEISRTLSDIVYRMMRKKREDRYQNFDDLIKDLEDLQDEPVKIEKEPNFKKCFVPKLKDVLLAQIAINEKITTSEKIGLCLMRQESLYLVGIDVDITHIMVEQELIGSEKLSLLHNIFRVFLLESLDKYFFELCEEENILDVEDMKKAKDHKKSGFNGIVEVLLKKGKISSEVRDNIHTNVQNLLHKKENKILISLATKNSLISREQAHECNEDYRANLIGKKYSPMEKILIEKGFLHEHDISAILRAYRMHKITGTPIEVYLNQKKKKDVL